MTKVGGGVRRVSCAVDGRRVPDFDIYPDTFERFPNEADRMKCLERQALSMLEMFGQARGQVRYV